MDILTVMERFNTQETCLKFIEQKRFLKTPCCVHCGSLKGGRKYRCEYTPHWNCYDCYSTFSTTSKTLFLGTRVPLPKWFLAIALMTNAKNPFLAVNLLSS